MLVKMESWVKGGSSAAPHLQLLCFLLQSSLAAQRQLLQDTGLAERYMCTPAGSAFTQDTCFPLCFWRGGYPSHKCNDSNLKRMSCLLLTHAAQANNTSRIRDETNPQHTLRTVANRNEHHCHSYSCRNSGSCTDRCMLSG